MFAIAKVNQGNKHKVWNSLTLVKCSGTNWLSYHLQDRCRSEQS